jgi:hypothetical protein
MNLRSSTHDPHILNAIVGIALVYCAVLVPQLLQKTAWVLLASGIGIIVLGLLARGSDRKKEGRIALPSFHQQRSAEAQG